MIKRIDNECYRPKIRVINDLAYKSDKEEIRRRGKIVDRVTTSVA